MKEAQDLSRGSVWKQVARMGIPAIISMIVVVVYNMADTFFVGQTHNDMMVAAVSLAAPIFSLMITVGTLIGSGGCSVISSALGSGSGVRARQISSFCAYAAIGAGLLFAAVLTAFTEQILLAMGATEYTLAMATGYTRWIAAGAVFIIFSNTLSNVIRAEGTAQESMIGNLIGTVANMVLDPIMILGMDMGVAGAAIATVLGNICACLYYLHYFRSRKDSLLSVSIKDFAVGDRIAVSVFAIGVPGALGNLLMSVSNISAHRLWRPGGGGYGRLYEGGYDRGHAANGTCVRSAAPPFLSLWSRGAGPVERDRSKNGDIVLCFGHGPDGRLLSGLQAGRRRLCHRRGGHRSGRFHDEGGHSLRALYRPVLSLHQRHAGLGQSGRAGHRVAFASGDRLCAADVSAGRPVPIEWLGLYPGSL